MSADPVLIDVVQLHAEETAMLHGARARLTRAPHIALEALARMDARIAAHLDGMDVAARSNPDLPDCLSTVDGGGATFTLTVRALEERNRMRLDELIGLAHGDPDAFKGLLSATAWVEPSRLRGLIPDLLGSAEPARRIVGISASAMHRVDPRVATCVQDQDPRVRARAFRAAGEIGKQELVSLCARCLADPDPGVQFWAAWSAVLLGDRQSALDFLAERAGQEHEWRPRAVALALRAMPVGQGHSLLQGFAQIEDQRRDLVHGSGLVGDPAYVPWLIGQMSDDRLARLAGESFTMITGLDLSRPPFYREHPANFESGPTEDPADENVGMDEDDDLPWPDQAKVQEWWGQNAARFTIGVRHFMGAPPGRAHCIHVLKNGYQRQRIAAAFHLVLLNPGTPLFEWRAPASRQQSALAQMS